MFREVAEIYRASKKKVDINRWTEWVCRPVAAVLVYFLKSTPITPNQVTFLSMLICIGSGALFVLMPGYEGVVAGAAVLELSYVFDCADGQLSRVRKTSSVLGHLLDFLMDEIKAMLVFGCVTVRLWRTSGDETYLLVGIAALWALASGLSLTSFTRRPEYGAKQPTKDGQPAQIRKRRGPVGLTITGLEHTARFFVHYPTYIWLAAVLDRIDLYFWAYAAVNALYALRMFAAILLRLGGPNPPMDPPRATEATVPS